MDVLQGQVLALVTTQQREVPFWEYALLATILLLFVGVQILTMTRSLVWDEAAFLGNARRVWGESKYTEDFRNPLLPFIIGTSWLVAGESVFAGRMVSVLAGVAAILLTYALARHHTRHAIWLVVLVATNTQFLFWSGFAYAEILTIACTLLGAYLFERAETARRDEPSTGRQEARREARQGLRRQEGGWRALSRGAWWYLGVGVAFGLGFLARFAGAIIILTVGAYLLLRDVGRRSLKRTLFFAVGILLPVLPWMLNNYRLHANPFWDAQTQATTIATYTTAQPLALLLVPLLVGSLAFFVIIMFGALFGARRPQPMELLWWSNFVLFLLLHAFIIRLKFARYSLALLPFLVILAAYGLGSAERPSQPSWRRLLTRWMTLALLLLVLLSAVPSAISFFHEKERLQVCDELVPLSVKVLDGILREDALVDPVLGSNIWVYFGYLNNVNVFSLYTPEWEVYMREVAPDYILYQDTDGLAFDEDILRGLERDGTLLPAQQIRGACGTITIWRATHVIPQQT